MALTFSVRSNPGVYALLLGSGVSSEAEVPTGWGVVKDLIRKIADAEGEDPEPDPVDWYEDYYGETPEYDELIEQLAPTDEERQALLEGYFEPTPEEREQGIKTPSEAHESIAWLVEKEYIRVIITTNFDRLLEKALEERGVTPSVIRSPSEARGATPLAHEDAVILKVNGDYKYANIKNTREELAEYEPDIWTLLDRIFDEYGLIVCGWSGDWDTALRKALLECESRRYSTFWAYRSELRDTAEEIVGQRDGLSIQIEGASQFFYELKENVQALENSESGAPLTREVARERVKRYMTREERKIDLADLIQNEVERVRHRIFDESRYPLVVDGNGEVVEDRLESYEQEVKTLVTACSTCAFWGPVVENPAINELGVAVRRIGTRPSPEGGVNNHLDELRRYPGMVLLYGIGVPAIISDNWELLHEILVNTKIQVSSSLVQSAVIHLHPSRCHGDIPTRPVDSGTRILKRKIKANIRDSIRDFIPDDNQYQNGFFRFEALSDLVLYERWERESSHNPYVPDNIQWDDSLSIIFEEIESEGEAWEGFKAGLFEGSLDRFEAVHKEFR